MPARQFIGSQNYRYGFGTQEKDDEIYGAGNSYTAEYWEYDPRLGRRWNTDPISYPWKSPYATFNNNPIYFNDPSGLDGEPPPSEYDDDGDGISEANEGCDAVEISASKGNASPGWTKFVKEFYQSGAWEEYKAAMYQAKLDKYKDGLGKLAYGTDSNGMIDIPASIQEKSSNEVEQEALPALKSAWAANESGVDPSSWNYALNPFAKAQYLSTRA